MITSTESIESSDFGEDKTLPEDASKQYGLQPYQFEPYAAENRSADYSTDQEETPVDCEHGVTWTVSNGEHFCCFLPRLFFFFSPLSFFTQGNISWGILNTILCHKYHPNHSNRVICSEGRQHLEMGEYTIDLFCRHQRLGSVREN